ncbi:MAG: 16S rRNA (uracil(1498)-N(3))-methyltransferase [Pseudomonadota bacterium]
MRLTRVFVDAPLAQDALLPLPPGPAQHLVRVLRLGAGDALVVFNGRGGEYAARIESIQRDKVAARIGVHAAIERESPLATTLLQGVARGEKMDQILQKATELGITRVVPVLTARSNVRLDAGNAARKQEHWRGVAVGACEQSGRNRIPEIATPASLATALASSGSGLRLVLTPDDGAASLQSLATAAMASASGLHAIVMLVGPEGGLDPQEIDAAHAAGFTACGLGPRVLRTETAALAVLAALQFAAGDFADRAQ